MTLSPAFAGELSPPGPGAVELGFCASDLKAVRRFADRHAQAAGLNAARMAGDLPNGPLDAGEAEGVAGDNGELIC